MYTKKPETDRAPGEPGPAPARISAPDSSDQPDLEDRRIRNALDALLRHDRGNGSSSAPPELTDSEHALIFRSGVATGSSANAFDLHPADAPSDSQPPAIPGYEQLEAIRTGGQGVVYRATQLSTRRTVAIKLTRAAGWKADSQRQRFEREVALTSRLNHPHIVTIFDSGEADGRLYFVMEYVDGAPVDEFALLKKLPIRDCVRLVVAICRAVQYAHLNGIIHRDLKPSNILVDAEGRPHILDFGLAKDLITPAPVNPAEAPSMSGQVVGTLPYLSPEQAAGRSRDADIRADVYTLGVILFQILSRQFPYSVVGHPDDVRANIISRPPLPLRRALANMSIVAPRADAPMLAELEAVLLRTLEKAPDRRYQSVGELADDLERCLTGEPVQARQHDRWFLLRRTLRAYRTHVLIAAAFALVLLVAAAGVFIAWRRSEQVAQIATDGLTMGSFNRLAQVANDINRSHDAVVLYERALAIGARSATDDPVIVQMALTGYFEWGRILEKYMEFVKLEECVQRAAELSNRLLKLAPNDPVSHFWRAKTLRLRGMECNVRKNWAAGLPALLEARDITIRLWNNDPENDTIVVQLASIMNALGKCFGGLNLAADSYEAYCASLQLSTYIVWHDPRDIDAMLGICTSECNLAAWHIKRQTPADYHAAIEYTARAEKRLLGLSAAGSLATRLDQAENLFAAIWKNSDLARQNLRKLGLADDSYVPISTGSISPSTMGSVGSVSRTSE